MAKLKTLSIIGAGAVGKTIGKLFAKEQLFAICDVVDKSRSRAGAGSEFIGQGNPLTAISAMCRADIYLLSVPDAEIIDCSSRLSEQGIIQNGSIVFHCSGSLPSGVMKGVISRKGLVASIHPVKSFTDAANGVGTFKGTFCGTEGDRKALDVLLPAFESIGAHIFTIAPDKKAEFHTATAIVCNFLPALIEFGLRIYEKAEFKRDEATEIISPIVRETVENILTKGTAEALTGPIIRGDCKTVETHLEILKNISKDYSELYRLLSLIVKDLAGDINKK